MPTFDLNLTSRGLGYDEETVEGTTDVPGASTALTHMGITDSITLTHMENPTFVRLNGGEDLYSIKGGAQFHTLMWDMGFFQMTELAYGINANVGAGTINKSLFLLGAVKINGGATTSYIEMNRSRFNQTVVSGAIGSELRANITAFGKMVEAWPTALPTNWTLPVVPTTDVWGFDSAATSTPVAWGSDTPDVVSIDMAVTRNLLRRPGMGARGVTYNKPGPRDIRATMMVGWADQNAWNDMTGSTARTLAWTLEATPHKLTALGCKVYAASDPFNIRTSTRGGNPAPYEVLQQLVIGGLSIATS